MRTLFSILIVSILLGAVACQDSGKPSRQNDQEIRDNDDLEKILKPLVAIYEGEVSNPLVGADPFPVQINVFMVREQTGVNDDGEIMFRPALQGRYRRLDFPPDLSNEKSLLIRYYPETGQIALGTTISASGGGVDSGFLSISGKWSNNQITGEIANHRSVLGTIHVTKVNP